MAQREQSAFLEWAHVHGNLYGTRQAEVEGMLAAGTDVLLEIDWQGAQQVAELMPSAVRVFISPPSLDELRRRLIARGQDTNEVIERRIAAAQDEMTHACEAHHRIINDDFDETLKALLSIFTTR